MMPLRLPSSELRIVCLGAHPDDVEIGCGGTLLSLAESSRTLSATVVVATGSGERYDEAMKAAPRFLPGAEVEVRVLELRDGYLPTAWAEVKEGFEEFARSSAPDIVFAPRLDDAHQDHRVVAEIVSTVWRDSVVMRYEIPKWDGDLARVTHYIPLGDETAHRKLALLDESFSSQADRGWWGSETFLGLMRLRGVECRSRYAEGFLVDRTVVGLS
jgi:LmbE family N-acetylglucosaminyl deacetylase